MKICESIPKWQRELTSFKGIKSTFIIEGNINDLYLNVNQEMNEPGFDSLNETLDRIFNGTEEAREYDLMFCDPLFGFSDPLNQNTTAELARRYQEIAKQQRKETEALGEGRTSNDSHALISEIIRAAITKRNSASDVTKSVAVVVNFASRLISRPDHLDPAEITMFLNLLYSAKNAIRADGNENINTLILIADKFNDIPAWFYLNNPNVRTITIPNPDRSVRKAFISSCFEELNTGGETFQKLKDKFIDMTEGMKLLELDELRRLYQKSRIPVTEIADTVAIYKFGFKENKWQTMRDRIKDDIASKMRLRVKGQEQAIEKISCIIKRSVTGLSGMQHSASGNKPRGILFLAGPTGTGKTEIVKTVAELLFGDEKALIRFDMSEYTAEHSDQKLFGAPPGYIGYDQGGQLTNAVKANPFSVLLFDEIEKAHPSIMDKFLQILEDGRMTDGQGNTVYFSETLIFFTSNDGITKETCDAFGRVIKRETVVKPGSAYREIQEGVESALKTRFKPEVMNRIGKNIIVFNYITEGATKEILESQIETIVQEIRRKSKIDIGVDDSAARHLLTKCLEKDTRENGGRGIGNVVENSFLNPLAEFIFDTDVEEGSEVKITSTNDHLVFERTV